METGTDQTKERTAKHRRKIEIPIPHGKQTENMKIKNRKPRIPRIYRLGGIRIIGTSGMAITIGPEIRVGAKTRGRQPKERVVSLKVKVETRGVER